MHSFFFDNFDCKNRSFNGIGDAGGVAIGGSLFTNTTIKSLNLSNNSITTRAAFTIGIALQNNKVLEDINLQSNPLGKVGGQALMRVPLVDGNHLIMHLEQCDFTIEDPSFMLDSVTTIPREPCDRSETTFNLDLSKSHRRAIGLEIIRVATQVPGFYIERCELNGRSINLEKKILNAPSLNSALFDQITKIDRAIKSINETWNRYDCDDSGTLNAKELEFLLRDLGLDFSKGSTDRIFATYDCTTKSLP